MWDVISSICRHSIHQPQLLCTHINLVVRCTITIQQWIPCTRYPTVCACVVGTTNLHTGICSVQVPSYTGTVVPHGHCFAITTITLLQHQTFAPQIPLAINPPVMPEPDWVSKHTSLSLVPRPRVWQVH